MKIGDNVLITSKFGEFETNIDGTIVEFYREGRAIVRTKAGHDWAIPTAELRLLEKKHPSTWNM